MRTIALNAHVIHASVKDVLMRARQVISNGKLKDINEGRDDLTITCPFHSDGHEKKPACHVYVGDDQKLPYGYYYCFVCGSKGPFIKLLAAAMDCSEEAAEAWAASEFPSEEKRLAIDLGPDIAVPSRRGKPGLDEKELDKYQSWCPYLGRRGLSRSTCEKFKVKYDPEGKQVIFPCYDERGRLVMLPSRSVVGKAFMIDKGAEKPLYCLNQVLKEGKDCAIITEGPFDCLTGWEYGYPTIATFGRISKSQIQLLNRSGLKTLYLGFDNDAAGRSFAATLRRWATRRMLLVDLKIPDGKKDLNDLTKAEFDKMMEEAKNSGGIVCVDKAYSNIASDIA